MRLGRRRTDSVATQILLLQLLVVGCVVLAGLTLAYVDARADQRRHAEETVTAVALSVAASPVITTALRTSDPSSALQPYAERVRRDTGTDFVVTMTTEGVRLTHPNPGEIGRRYIGSIDEARAGRTLVETYRGTLGPSIRAVVPVRDSGVVTGLVSVGITTAKIERGLLLSLPPIIVAAALILLVSTTGAVLISRRLRRQTHGLGEREITRMYEYYEAVLHAVREGLLLLDANNRILLANDEAQRLLGLSADPTGRPLAAVGLPSTLVTDIESARPLRDEIHVVGAKLLVLNRTQATRSRRVLGSVVTIRDRTELQAVVGELDSVRSLAESLRSVNHESANRLHTVVSLIEMGRTDDAVEFATGQLESAQRLADRVVSAVDDPVVAAMLLGKSAQAAERGVELVIDPNSTVSEHSFDRDEVVTLIGNLLDNALDAVAETPAPHVIQVRVEMHDTSLRLRVEDSGPGLSAKQRQRAFERGWSSKIGHGPRGRGIGLALVAQAVHRHGGTIEVERSPLGGACFDIVIEGAGANPPSPTGVTTAGSV
jgi:two-component system, CitB family, sensor kinase